MPRTPPDSFRDAFPLLSVAGSAALAWAVLGYHPYAEDGGIYAAALAARLEPALFPTGHEWVAAPAGYALFVPLAAMLCRTAHVSLGAMLLCLHLLCLAATLAALHQLASVCMANPRGRSFAVLLTAPLLGLPVAGTALYLLDPSVTSRSFTTPLLLLVLTRLLQRRWLSALLLWAGALALHPLMAGWAAVPALALLLTEARLPGAVVRLLSRALGAGMLAPRISRRLLWLGILSLACIVMVGNRLAPELTGADRLIAATRGYWFLGEWRWFEWLGALLPPLLLLLLERMPSTRSAYTAQGRHLILTAAVSSVAALLLAGGLAWSPAHATTLSRLQPLRILHLVFSSALLLIAVAVIEAIQDRWRPVLCAGITAAAALVLFTAQRSLYPGSDHLELPWRLPSNPWEQAFLWIRSNTPVSTVFALDADYTTVVGEDAQNFRAVALRSSLPDAAKDAGVASVVPRLSGEAAAAIAMQNGLNRASDAERVGRLRGSPADWIVLPAGSPTHLLCPYTNAVVQVCRLR